MNNTLNAMYIAFITREYIRLVTSSVTSPSVLWKSPFLNRQCQLVALAQVQIQVQAPG